MWGNENSRTLLNYTCTEHEGQRRELASKLNMIGVQLTMINILGGGGYGANK